MPFRNGIVGCQPRARILVTSKSFRGVPSGFVLSQTSSPSNSTTSQINSASSRMETSSPQPMLMISGESYFSSNKRQAAARSSTCKNSARFSASPHDQLFLTLDLRLVRLAKKRGEYMRRFQIEVVVRPVKICRHDRDEVVVVLTRVCLAKFDAGNLCNRVRFIGWL